MKWNVKRAMNAFFVLINLTLQTKLKAVQFEKPIDIKIFYDTQSSDSEKVFVNSIEPYYENEDFSSRINLYLIPGAKMTYEITEDNDVYFNCQRGEDECLGNMFHACAFYKLPKMLAYKYIICFMVNIKRLFGNNFETTQFCSDRLNFDANPISVCAQENEGRTHILAMLKRKNVLKQPVYFSPWAVVNGQHDSKVEEEIFTNLTEYACKLLKYPTTIKICKSYKEFFGANPEVELPTNSPKTETRIENTNSMDKSKVPINNAVEQKSLDEKDKEATEDPEKER